jgi:hypothetical protein
MSWYETLADNQSRLMRFVSHVCQHAAPIVRIKTCDSATEKPRQRWGLRVTAPAQRVQSFVSF